MKKMLLAICVISTAALAVDSEPVAPVKIRSNDEANTVEVDSNSRLGVKVRGATDNTAVGNVSDRLKVDATFSVLPTITANQGTQGTFSSPWFVNLRNNAGTEIATGANPIRVDPTGTTPQPATQSGTWTTGRTWVLGSGTDSVSAVQSGTWTTGRTWTLSSGTDSIAAVQSGTWTVQPGNTPNTVPWLVSMRGVISNNNSSTTPLGVSAVFTGTGEDVTNYGNVSVNVFSDKAGTIAVQWSSNNTNWDITGDTYTVAASTGKTFSFGPAARYFRIVFTNGGVAQTAFRLQTTFRDYHTKPSSHRLADAIPVDSDLEATKAQIVDSGGNNLTGQTSGSQRALDVGINQGGNTVAVNEFNEMSTNNGNQLYNRSTGNGTTVIKSGTGVLHGIIIGNAATNGQITIYDNTAGSGTVIMDLDVGSPSGGLLSTSGFPNPVFGTNLSIRFNTGLTIVRAGSANNDVTILYR